MKHFISSMTLQPFLNPVHYNNTESVPMLENSMVTPFPALIPISNLAKGGEKIRVTTIITKDPDGRCAGYYNNYLEELERLAQENGFQFTADIIEVDYSESSAKQLKLFEDLICNITPDEELIADVTYGNKPTPMVMLMALSYAYRYIDNTSVKAVIYGELDHTKKADRSKGEVQQGNIFDVSSLFYLNSVMTQLASLNPEDPLGFIKGIIG